MFGKTIKTQVLVEGMHCEHCASRVKSELEKIDGIGSVKVNINKKLVTIYSKKELDISFLKKKIEDLGYMVKDNEE